MGKTQKKIHRKGQVRHAETPNIQAQLELAEKAYRSSQVVCVACCQCVELGAIVDNGRHCPACGADLSEEACDEAAAQLLGELDFHRAYVQAAQKAASQVEALSGGKGLVRKLELAWTRLVLLWRERKAKSHTEALSETQRYLGSTAYTRYYAGIWFEQTRIPLARSGGGRGDMRVKARYERDGAGARFLLVNERRSEEASGFIAEFDAFEELRVRSKDPASVLFGCELAANLYLPYSLPTSFDSRSAVDGGLKPLWCQVDAMALTPQAVFVIEVKKRRRVVIDPERFSLRTDLRKGRLEPSDYMIDQCDAHARKLCELYPELPEERVLEVLEFVKPVSITGAFEDFEEGICIGGGCCERGVVDVMERYCATHEAVLGEELPKRIAAELRQRYGDPCQSKRERHVRRLREIEELARGA